MLASPKKSVFKSKGDKIFYGVMMAWPLLQFVVFYLVVNFNSILLAFQKIDVATNTSTFTLVNFADAFRALFKTELVPAFRNSFVLYLLNLVCGVGLGLLFSYYVSKKMPCSGFFRVLLFMPSILSAVVMTGAFSKFVDAGIPALVKRMSGGETVISGLLENNKYTVATLMFYNILVGFGTSVLMYSNSMSGISQEIYEAAKIDGAKGMREFVSVTLPMIFGTVSTFLVAGIAGIFTNQMNIIAFYGTNIPDPSWHTLGSYIYAESLKGSASGGAAYPFLSALGIYLTLIAAPITLIVKKLLQKYGPGED